MRSNSALLVLRAARKPSHWCEVTRLGHVYLRPEPVPRPRRCEFETTVLICGTYPPPCTLLVSSARVSSLVFRLVIRTSSSSQRIRVGSSVPVKEHTCERCHTRFSISCQHDSMTIGAIEERSQLTIRSCFCRLSMCCLAGAFFLRFKWQIHRDQTRTSLTVGLLCLSQWRSRV